MDPGNAIKENSITEILLGYRSGTNTSKFKIVINDKLVFITAPVYGGNGSKEKRDSH